MSGVCRQGEAAVESPVQAAGDGVGLAGDLGGVVKAADAAERGC